MSAITALNKNEEPLILRSVEEIGAAPNIFVSAEVFAEYEANADSYTRQKAIAECQELKELAKASGQFHVARKLVVDITRLRLMERGAIPLGMPPPTDEELGPVQAETRYLNAVREKRHQMLEDSFKKNKEKDLARLHRENARVDGGWQESLAEQKEEEEEEKEAKNLSELVADLNKKFQEGRKDFTRDTAYASFEELRIVSSLRGCLDIARRTIQAKCQICDIPALQQRRFIKSPKEQRKEAEEQARLAEETARLAEEAARLVEEKRRKEEAAKITAQAELRLALEKYEAAQEQRQKQIAEAKEAAVLWKKIEYFVGKYPIHGGTFSQREAEMKTALVKAHAYAAEQKRLGSQKAFPITPASVRRIHDLLFKERVDTTPGYWIEDPPGTDKRLIFAPYLTPDSGPTPEDRKQQFVRHINYRVRKLTDKYMRCKKTLEKEKLGELECSIIKLREKRMNLLYRNEYKVCQKVYVDQKRKWTLEEITRDRENLIEKINKEGWGKSFEEKGQNEMRLLLLDRGIFRLMYEDEEMREKRERRGLMIFVGLSKQPFRKEFDLPGEMSLSDYFSEYRNWANSNEPFTPSDDESFTPSNNELVTPSSLLDPPQLE